MASNRPGVLLEREAELRALSALTDEACAGAGRVALIEGPPGIGKTALLEATVALAAERDVTVLVARGGELEREFAFGVVRQLFEPVVASMELAERAALFSGAAGLAAPLLGAPETAAAPPAAGEVFPLLHGLYWLSVGLSSSQPCLIAIDDVHWADEPSLRFVYYLARRLEQLPILIALAGRSTEPEAPVALVDAIRAERVVSAVQPEPLSEPAAAAVLREVFGAEPDEEFTRASHQATGGNPFLLTELARELAADGSAPVATASARVRAVRPAAIVSGVLVRLGHLSPAARAIARALAVLGADVTLRQAASLADIDESVASEAADALSAAALLEPGPALRFTHPLIRSAVYGDLGTAERARLHKRAASILAADSVAHERVAAHLLLTEPAGDLEVVDRLRAAAESAYDQGALGPVREFLRRALVEPPPESMRAAVLLELGTAESRAADPDAAVHLLEAFRLAGDPLSRATVAEAAVPFLLGAGRTQEALDLLDTALGEVAVQDADRAMQLEAHYVAAAMQDPGATALAVERLERVGEELGGDSVGERMMLCYLAYQRTWRSEDAERAADLAERAVGGGRLIADRGVRPPELTGPIMTLICADRLDAAAAIIEDALADARARGSEHALSFVSCMRSGLALRRGVVDDAEAEARAGLEMTLRSGLALGAAVNAGLLIAALTERGALEEAEEVLGSVGFAEHPVPPVASFAILLSARGRLRIARGERESGLADLLECGERSAVFGLRNPVFAPWRSDAALAQRSLGQLEAARRLANEEHEAARTWGTPGTIGSAERLSALLADDAEEAIAGFGRAVKLLERSPARLEHARALTDLGATLRRANRRAEAREPLREGLDLALRCGATVLTERARAELQATGARPRRLALSGVASLTPSERRVAELAAKGLSNPEIAQALFVTRKTVETHLGHTYAKLEIGSRAELPSTLAAGE